MSIQMRSSGILIQKLEAGFGNDIQIYTLDKFITTKVFFINKLNFY